MRFHIFAVVFFALLAEAELVVWKDFSLFQQAIIDFIFPKNPNVMRIRNLEQARSIQGVTTLDFIGLVERHGYPAEEHHVTTEDGYNLVIHRIPGSSQSRNQQTKKIVFLQHGITCTSDCWAIFGAGKDLPFLLADVGYDVWLGNVRGNSYCRSHVTMSPRNRDFWQFSYHESGTQDLPVMIDYVLHYTRQKTLRYIGHSMGSTTLFVLLSTRPEYNAKISLAVCLAPAAFWSDYPPILGAILNITPLVKQFLDTNEIYELISLSSTSILIGRELCADNTFTQPLCVSFFFSLGGADPAQLNTTALPELFSQYPAGVSVNTAYHYYQNIITNKFLSYDYGYFGNFKRYGQRTPVRYALEKITAPLALFYGANDLLVPKANVLRLYKQLPNVVLLEELPYKFFNHLDFLWAIDAKGLIYDRVIEVLQKFVFEPSLVQ